jgi:hypothetical protein
VACRVCHRRPPRTSCGHCRTADSDPDACEQRVAPILGGSWRWGGAASQLSHEDQSAFALGRTSRGKPTFLRPSITFRATNPAVCPKGLQMLDMRPNGKPRRDLGPIPCPTGRRNAVVENGHRWSFSGTSRSQVIPAFVRSQRVAVSSPSGTDMALGPASSSNYRATSDTLSRYTTMFEHSMFIINIKTKSLQYERFIRSVPAWPNQAERILSLVEEP